MKFFFYVNSKYMNQISLSNNQTIMKATNTISKAAIAKLGKLIKLKHKNFLTSEKEKKKNISTLNNFITKHYKKILALEKEYIKTKKLCINIIENILTTIEKTNSNENDKKRAICENPCTELISALMLVDPAISFEDIVNKTSIPNNLKCPEDEFHKYIDDMKLRMNTTSGEKSLREYYTNFKTHVTQTSFIDHVLYVIVCGKKNHYEEVDTANADLDSKNAKDAKSDIMIMLDNDKPVGMSIKASKEATKSNYSVPKFFAIDEQKTCKEVKTNMLADAGYPLFKKEERKEHNALFYNSNNPFFNLLRDLIAKHNKDIAKSMVESLCGTRLAYDLYEFDGKDLMKLNKDIDYEAVQFYECEEFYLKDNGERRETAKMFYKLVNGSSAYRVEVRWKGNIHTAFPQFQIHNI